jgi:hypothetical protein
MRRSRYSAVVSFCLSIAAFAAMAPAAMSQRMVTVPAGTQILVRMLDSVDSNRNPPGFRFTATLETNLVVGGRVIVPAGNTVFGRLTAAQQAGRVAGSSALALELTDIVVRGTAFPIFSNEYQIQGQGSGGRTARRALGGAGLGAIIGGIAGGAGRGAAIGATAGGVSSAAQRGQSIQIPSETLLQFRLQHPASLPAP